MDISQLTDEMHSFVRSQGWYEEGTPRQQNLRNLAISLVLESSEVLEHFQWNGELDDREEFAAELADVALYLLQLASVAEINLEKAILAKLESNYQRSWDDQDVAER